MKALALAWVAGIHSDFEDQHFIFWPGGARLRTLCKQELGFYKGSKTGFRFLFNPFQVNGMGMGGFVRGSGGTGVFLPRFVTTTDDRKKLRLTAEAHHYMDFFFEFFKDAQEKVLSSELNNILLNYGFVKIGEKMARKKIREYDSKQLLKEHFKRISSTELGIKSAQVTETKILVKLPVAVLRQRRDGNKMTTYEYGFRVGFRGNYTGRKDEKYFPETDLACIVDFDATPNRLNRLTRTYLRPYNTMLLRASSELAAKEGPYETLRHIMGVL
ncbi:hypothetical protein HHK36_012771 [Tetracentron sinense]|uniref:Uncharacterized protein n=1 Tax=Tetracentron sinense TaxID=13715 RepID=A0A834Z7E9_TETSI|nr:hypothetical protein HHK36_012771 [Tetracentron sinense]